MTFDAIVLCGGSARRLDGADKGAVMVGGRSLLERAIEAVGAAEKIVAVGPERGTSAQVAWTREDPPGGGPVGAIAAGLEATTADVVVVLGVDFPFVDPGCIRRLLDARGDRDGAILADGTGHPQFLVGAYKRSALMDRSTDAEPRDRPVRDLVADLDLEILVDPRSTRDCDTWDDVAEAERLMSG